MATAPGIQAGGATVTISTNHTAFDRGMGHVYRSLNGFSHMLRRVGTAAAVSGAGLGYPLIRATQAAAGFEDALLELEASVPDATPKQLKAVRDEALRLAGALGLTPTEIAKSFALLIKAGMSVDDALNGAARSAVEFARVSGVGAEEAATFMKIAMNVFGVSAQEAVDTLSAAADVSETSISSMVQSFSLVSSAGKAFGQTLFGLSQGLAALAGFGIMGEEAGTGLKILFTKLVAPTNEAQQALARYGLTVRSFRGADGELLPLVQMADILSQKMKNVDRVLNDQTLVDVFDQRGIKVITALALLGRKGMEDLAKAMEDSRSVGEKFKIMTGGLTGFFLRLQSAVQVVSIAFGEALSPTLRELGETIGEYAKKLHDWIKAHPEAAKAAAVLAGSLVGLSTATIFLSFVMSGLRDTVWGVGRLFAVATSGALRLARALYHLSQAAGAVQAVGGARGLGGFLRMLAANPAAAAIGGLAALTIGGSMLSAFRAGSKGKPAAAAEPAAPAAARVPAQQRKPIKRDPFEDPMASRGTFGDGLGTVSGDLATQLGVGPTLNAGARIIAATERTADEVERVGDLLEGAMNNGAGVDPAAAAKPPQGWLDWMMGRQPDGLGPSVADHSPQQRAMAAASAPVGSPAGVGRSRGSGELALELATRTAVAVEQLARTTDTMASRFARSGIGTFA